MNKLLLLAVALLIVSCASAVAAPVIHLAELEPLPTTTSAGIVPLRVAVAAIISPQGTVESYQPLLDYISTELHRPIELIQRQTYAEVNDLIENGQVDLAFVCTAAYITGKSDFGMELLAAPQVNGEAVYYSILIVPTSSEAESIADLKGTTFAFTDPLSTTGRLYPTFLLQQQDSTPTEFFSRTFFTFSHDDAIQAVANGVADGAAVDSLVYDFAVKRDPTIAERTKIIHRSPAFGAPPVVVHPNIRPQLRATLQHLMLNLTETEQGQAALAAMGFDRFVQAEYDDYESIRDLLQTVEIVANE